MTKTPFDDHLLSRLAEARLDEEIRAREDREIRKEDMGWVKCLSILGFGMVVGADLAWFIFPWSTVPFARGDVIDTSVAALVCLAAVIVACVLYEKEVL